jgi:hypothetical protein
MIASCSASEGIPCVHVTRSFVTVLQRHETETIPEPDVRNV